MTPTSWLRTRCGSRCKTLSSQGLKDRTVDPSHPEQLRELTRDAIRSSPVLKAVIDAANRYSPTVYDINIGDNELRTLLSTNPENDDKPLPGRPSYKELLNTNSVDLMRRVFSEEARVYEISVSLERNGAPFATVRVGVRTTFLREVYKPWLEEAFTLMRLCARHGAAGGVAAVEPGSPAA